MVQVYGISNCGSVKKAFSWLSENGIKFQFHDFKNEAVTQAKIEAWLTVQPLEILLNKKSTAWKGLTLVAQKKCVKQSEAVKIMETTSNLIKRPVIEFGDKVIVGFDEVTYKEILIKK
jgi:Spx/MgsR family transcriptional regulator